MVQIQSCSFLIKFKFIDSETKLFTNRARFENKTKNTAAEEKTRKLMKNNILSLPSMSSQCSDVIKIIEQYSTYIQLGLMSTTREISCFKNTMFFGTALTSGNYRVYKNTLYSLERDKFKITKCQIDHHSQSENLQTITIDKFSLGQIFFGLLFELDCFHAESFEIIDDSFVFVTKNENKSAYFISIHSLNGTLLRTLDFVFQNRPSINIFEKMIFNNVLRGRPLFQLIDLFGNVQEEQFHLGPSFSGSVQVCKNIWPGNLSFDMDGRIFEISLFEKNSFIILKFSRSGKVQNRFSYRLNPKFVFVTSVGSIVLICSDLIYIFKQCPHKYCHHEPTYIGNWIGHVQILPLQAAYECTVDETGRLFVFVLDGTTHVFE